MSSPEPHPGLVIRYAYLWKREHEEGREDGSKDRPCAIVLSIAEEDGEREVLVRPITRTPPKHASDAIEIPPATKRRLHLASEIEASRLDYNHHRSSLGNLTPSEFIQISQENGTRKAATV